MMIGRHPFRALRRHWQWIHNAAPRSSHHYRCYLSLSPDAPISPAPQTRRGIAGDGEEPELRVSLVGVSCVGTTTIGRILADRRGWPFFDLDEEIERHFGLSIGWLQARFLSGYSYRKDCAVVLERIATGNPDCVIACRPAACETPSCGSCGACPA